MGPVVSLEKEPSSFLRRDSDTIVRLTILLSYLEANIVSITWKRCNAVCIQSVWQQAGCSCSVSLIHEHCYSPSIHHASDRCLEFYFMKPDGLANAVSRSTFKMFTLRHDTGYAVKISLNNWLLLKYNLLLTTAVERAQSTVLQRHSYGWL